MRWSNAVELRAAGLIVATLLFLPQLALAQFTQQGPKLVGAGAVGNAYQGVSVALSADGNTAIVGGYGDDANVGAAWVFTRSNGSWTQQGNKLIGSDAVNAASQGYSVAISADGNTVLIGGPGDNPGTINDAAGAAWVFTRSGGVWTQQGSKLVGSGAVLAGAGGSGGQGYSVALSADGNTAVVGAPTDNAAAGAAWVFTRNSGVWTQLGSKLVGTGAVGKAEQGSSVAISGDGNTIIVGGPYDNAGAAWVFTQTAGVWTQQGNKLAITGYSVALSVDGNTAIIGLPRIGAAIFARTNGVWTQQGGYLIGSGAIGGWNGAAVSLSGDGNTAIVGGPADNPGAMGGGVGAVWFFAAATASGRSRVSSWSAVVLLGSRVKVSALHFQVTATPLLKAARTTARTSGLPGSMFRDRCRSVPLSTSSHQAIRAGPSPPHHSNIN